MKTIKIIELLNKIANKEEIPKVIKYRDNKYKLDYENKYKDVIDEIYFTEEINFDMSNLNDEVEIIEDKDTINIQNIPNLHYQDVHKMSNRDLENLYVDGYNVLLKAIKQIDNKLKEVK